MLCRIRELLLLYQKGDKMTLCPFSSAGRNDNSNPTLPSSSGLFNDDNIKTARKSSRINGIIFYWMKIVCLIIFFFALSAGSSFAYWHRLFIPDAPNCDGLKEIWPPNYYPYADIGVFGQYFDPVDQLWHPPTVTDPFAPYGVVIYDSGPVDCHDIPGRLTRLVLYNNLFPVCPTCEVWHDYEFYRGLFSQPPVTYYPPKVNDCTEAIPSIV